MNLRHFLKLLPALAVTPFVLPKVKPKRELITGWDIGNGKGTISVVAMVELQEMIFERMIEGHKLNQVQWRHWAAIDEAYNNPFKLKV